MSLSAGWPCLPRLSPAASLLLPRPGRVPVSAVWGQRVFEYVFVRVFVARLCLSLGKWGKKTTHASLLGFVDITAWGRNVDSAEHVFLCST